MTLKKTVLIMIAALLVLMALAGCAGKTDGEGMVRNDTQSSQAEAEQTEVKEADEAETAGNANTALEAEKASNLEAGKPSDPEAEFSVDRNTASKVEEVRTPEEESAAKLLYMGHASIRITTGEGQVIYIDPYAGDENEYEPAADLILVTHSHYDHNAVDKVENRNPDCRIITWEEALAGGEHQVFDLGYVQVEAVEAGYNSNHSRDECVGYVLTLSDGVSVYVSGDTSRTEQMPLLAEKEIEYAFFCCDGVYNMDLDEAAECAALVQAKHNIPYHVIPANGAFYDRERAEQFQAQNRLILDEGDEIELVKNTP